MKHGKLRREMVETARRMNALGINQGTSGNLGARAGKGLLVTPSGLDYERMGPADIVSMRFDGSWEAAEGRRPSSEWRFHRDILAARGEFGGIVHTHARYATVLACQRLEIPAFHYMVGIAGGETIRCAPYATFGTEELSAHALTALEGRKACLLANHGMIACGKDLAEALKIAVEVESLAAQYWHVLQLGQPKLLGKAEMRRVLDKFAAGYGYASGPGGDGEGTQT